jgi:Protein of unknown function (DUF3591)/Bromodomain/Zinc knuckle
MLTGNILDQMTLLNTDIVLHSGGLPVSAVLLEHVTKFDLTMRDVTVSSFNFAGKPVISIESDQTGHPLISVPGIVIDLDNVDVGSGGALVSLVTDATHTDCWQPGGASISLDNVRTGADLGDAAISVVIDASGVGAVCPTPIELAVFNCRAIDGDLSIVHQAAALNPMIADGNFCGNEAGRFVLNAGVSNRIVMPTDYWCPPNNADHAGGPGEFIVADDIALGTQACGPSTGCSTPQLHILFRSTFMSSSCHWQCGCFAFLGQKKKRVVLLIMSKNRLKYTELCHYENLDNLFAHPHATRRSAVLSLSTQFDDEIDVNLEHNKIATSQDELLLAPLRLEERQGYVAVDNNDDDDDGMDRPSRFALCAADLKGTTRLSKLKSPKTSRQHLMDTVGHMFGRHVAAELYGKELIDSNDFFSSSSSEEEEEKEEDRQNEEEDFDDSSDSSSSSDRFVAVEQVQWEQDINWADGDGDGDDDDEQEKEKEDVGVEKDQEQVVEQNVTMLDDDDDDDDDAMMFNLAETLIDDDDDDDMIVLGADIHADIVDTAEKQRQQEAAEQRRATRRAAGLNSDDEDDDDDNNNNNNHANNTLGDAGSVEQERARLMLPPLDDRAFDSELWPATGIRELKVRAAQAAASTAASVSSQQADDDDASAERRPTTRSMSNTDGDEYVAASDDDDDDIDDDIDDDDDDVDDDIDDNDDDGKQKKKKKDSVAKPKGKPGRKKKVAVSESDSDESSDDESVHETPASAIGAQQSEAERLALVSKYMGAQMRLPSMALPMRNESLASGDWLADVVWDGDDASSLRGAPLIVDENDSELLLDNEVTLRSAVEMAAQRKARADELRKAAEERAERAELRRQQREVLELEEYERQLRAGGRGRARGKGTRGGKFRSKRSRPIGLIGLEGKRNPGTFVKPDPSWDEFNVSLDNWYVRQRQRKEVNTRAEGPSVQHSVPALKLDFVPTTMQERERRQFHRPEAELSRARLTLLPGAPRPTDMQYEAEQRAASRAAAAADGTMGARSRARRSADGDHGNAWRHRADLTSNVGELVLLEYLEREPLLLSNVGMATRVINYYRRRTRADKADHASLRHGDTVHVAPTEPSPLLGEVPRGDTVRALVNNMFKAPIAEHRTATSDFLLVRPRGSDTLLVREMPTAFFVGQQQPLREVPAPNSRAASECAKNRLKGHIFRLFKRALAHSRDGLARVRIADVCAAFPNQSETSIRKRLKDVAEFKRGGDFSGWWIMKPDVSLPPEDEIRALASPEAACGYESMLVGAERLSMFGITHFSSPLAFLQAAGLVQNARIEAFVDEIEKRLELAPWNLSANFVASLNGRGHLALVGFADPTRCGAGFSYVRKRLSARTDIDAVGEDADDTIGVPQAVSDQLLTGTDGDLRRLTLDESQKLLQQFGVPLAKIMRLNRWERIAAVRQKSSEAARSGIAADVQRFARGRQGTAKEAQQMYAEKVNQIFEAQLRLIANADGSRAGDVSSDSDDDIAAELSLGVVPTVQLGAANATADDSTGSDSSDSDDDFGKDLETFLSADKSSSSVAAAVAPSTSSSSSSSMTAGAEIGRQPAAGYSSIYEEQQERDALLAMQERAKRARSAQGGDGGANTNASTATQSSSSSSTASTRRFVKRIVRRVNADGTVRRFVELVQDPVLVEHLIAEHQRYGAVVQPGRLASAIRKARDVDDVQTGDSPLPRRRDGAPPKRRRPIKSAQDGRSKLASGSSSSSTAPKRGRGGARRGPRANMTPEELARYQTKRAQKLKLLDKLRRLKRTKAKQDKLREQLARAVVTGQMPEVEPGKEGLQCSACGLPGHMRTNRSCPMYSEEEAARKRQQRLAAKREREERAALGVGGSRRRAGRSRRRRRIGSVAAGSSGDDEEDAQFFAKFYAEDDAEFENLIAEHERSYSAARQAAELASDQYDEPSTTRNSISAHGSIVRFHRSLTEKPRNALVLSMRSLKLPTSSSSSLLGGGASSATPSRRGYGPSAVEGAAPPRRASQRRTPSVDMQTIFNEILDNIKSQQVAAAFIRSVSKTDYSMYYKIIKRPMDLTKMTMKVRDCEYLTRRLFLDDLRLITSNCHTFCDTRYPALAGLADLLYAQAESLVLARDDELRHLENEVAEEAAGNDLVVKLYVPPEQEGEQDKKVVAD